MKDSNVEEHGDTRSAWRSIGKMRGRGGGGAQGSLLILIMRIYIQVTFLIFVPVDT